jgi:hypothetical protein
MNPAAQAMTESGWITIAQITTIGIVTMYCVGQVKAAIVALARAYEAKLAADTQRYQENAP